MVKTCLKTSRRKVLPSLPVVVFRLLEATEDESRSSKSLAELAGKDPALSSQILRLANSPLMNSGRPVKSLDQAALNLGVTTIRNLAVTVAVCQSFASLDIPGNFSIAVYWDHSLSCAIIAKLMASFSRAVAPEEAFLAGLLHDIGQLSLVIKDPTMFDKIVQNPRTGQTILDSEREVWGMDHTQEGYEFLKTWGLHQHILDCVRYHHREIKDLTNSTEIVRLITFADMLSHFLRGQSSLELDSFYAILDQLGLDVGPAGLEELLRHAESEIKTASRELGLKVSDSDRLPGMVANDDSTQGNLSSRALDFAVVAGTIEALLGATDQEELQNEVFSSLGILTDSKTCVFFLWKNHNLVGLSARGTRDDSLVNQIHVLGLEESIWEDAFRNGSPVHSHLFFKEHKKRIIDEQIEEYIGGDFLVVPVFAWGTRVGVLVLAMSWEQWMELEPGKDLLMLLSRQIGHVYKGLKYRRLWEKEHLINEVIIRKSPVGILLTDLSGGIIFCNPASRVLLGINSIRFRDLNIFHILGLDKGRMDSLSDRLSRGKTLELGRFRVVDTSDVPLWTNVRVASVTISGIDRLLFLVRDITAEVLLEKERQERSAWLEAELEKRTRELKKAQDRLIQAERLGAASELARKVVHEVNNPLGIIKNFLKILKIQRETGEIDVKTIDAISSEIDRVARIVNELGNFSQIQKTEGLDGAASVKMVVEQLEPLIKGPLEEKGVSFQVDIEADLPNIAISPDNLKQILINLIKNADEALGGSGMIVVRAFRDEDDPRFVVVEVADTGPGISEEIRGKIFDPFTTTKGGENSGLGLSVCYGLIKACGGEIMVREEEDFKTVIRIKLPAIGR